MTDLALAATVFICIFGGALLGIFIQSLVPKHHLDVDSKAPVQLVMGLVATMAALLLSLLVSSAHTFYDTQQGEVQQLCADIILLDQALLRYGAEARPARQLLRVEVTATVKAMSPVEGLGSANVRPQGIAAGAPGLFDVVESLKPATNAQRYDQSEALTLMASIATARLMMHEQSSNAIPTLLLGAMIAWLVVLFASFGMFARINATVIAAILVGALSVTAAILLTVAMNHPYGGLMRLSAAPLQGVLAELKQ